MQMQADKSRNSITDDFDKNSFISFAIEFAIEDLFPRTEVELTFGHRNDDFTAHDLAFHMSVSVVLASAIVAISLR